MVGWGHSVMAECLLACLRPWVQCPAPPKNGKSDTVVIRRNNQMSPNSRTDKLYYIHSIEYYAAMKMNKLQPHIQVDESHKQY
jgi:hypothetical protein